MKWVYYILLTFGVLFCSCQNISNRTEVSGNANPDLILDFNARLYKGVDNDRILLKRLQAERKDSLNNKKIFQIGWNFYKLGQWEDLKNASIILLERSEQSNDSIRLGWAHHFLGYYYANKYENERAVYHFLKTKKIFFDTKQNKHIPQCYINIARIQYFNSDFVGCQETFLKAFKHARANNDYELQYLSLIYIAFASNCIEEYDKAFEYANRALVIVKTFLRDKYDYLETCLNSIGFNLYMSGNYKGSIIFYKKALSQIESNNENPELYCLILDNLANSKLKLKDFTDLPNLYYESSRIRDSFNIDQGRNYNKLYLSEYFAVKKDTLKAIRFGKDALILSKRFNAPKDILDCLTHLILIDNGNSASYSQQYIEISDSLQLAERKSRNKFARIAFETDELTEEKDQAVLQKWIVLATSVVIFILGILLFIIKMQRAKQKELLFIQEQQKSDEAIYQLIHDQQIKIGEGRQSEKKRISIELHDGVMNRLASTRLNLFILNKKRDDETIEKCLTFIDDIQGIEKEIRQVAHDLSNDLFSGNTSFNLLLKALFAERKSISKFNLQTQIDHHINWEIIDNILKMNLYRILQEALQNCHKYAHAKNVFVTISKEEDILYVSIHDDGNGFDLKKVRKGIGLKNIGQRVDLLKGKLKIHARVGEGTMINITIPVSK
jgi:signal transduction histidine kinase